ncbi:MAG: hypothetical protein FWD23_12625, partial [Oscillospiraceae bacterium]|nr:hypothetical protein [Oscillospiraceae bacterium]
MFKKNKGILKKILWAAALIPLSLFILSAHASCQNSGNDEQDEADDTLETKEPLAPVNRDYKPSEALAGTLGIDLNKEINTDIIGPGVNFNFCYIKEMDLQKGGESAGFPNTAGMSEKDAQKAWDDFFGFIDYMDFTYVRFMVSCTMWEPVNDNSDPFDTDFAGGFVFSPDYRGSHPEVSENNYLYMEAMYKILDRFETAGKYVVLANWGRGSATFCPDGDNWLGEKSPDGFS